jgi:hypothetical protein
MPNEGDSDPKRNPDALVVADQASDPSWRRLLKDGDFKPSEFCITTTDIWKLYEDNDKSEQSYKELVATLLKVYDKKGPYFGKLFTDILNNNKHHNKVQLGATVTESAKKELTDEGLSAADDNLMRQTLDKAKNLIDDRIHRRRNPALGAPKIKSILSEDEQAIFIDDKPIEYESAFEDLTAEQCSFYKSLERAAGKEALTKVGRDKGDYERIYHFLWMLSVRAPWIEAAAKCRDTQGVDKSNTNRNRPRFRASSNKSGHIDMRVGQGGESGGKESSIDTNNNCNTDNNVNLSEGNENVSDSNGKIGWCPLRAGQAFVCAWLYWAGFMNEKTSLPTVFDIGSRQVESREMLVAVLKLKGELHAFPVNMQMMNCDSAVHTCESWVVPVHATSCPDGRW